MRVGIGIPNAVPGVDAASVVPWSREAEAAGFASLGVVDRIRYDGLEPLTTLGAAAGATSFIGLVTMVVIGPLRTTAVLAKQAAALDSVSGGRFVLGLAVGARTEDYAALDVPSRGRGNRLADQLVELRRCFETDGFGPLASPNGPPLLVGGTSDVTFERIARSADGYVHGGGPVRTFTRAAEKTRKAWADHGRIGRPSLWAQAYFALGGEEASAAGRSYLLDYYSFTGPFARTIAAALLDTPQAVVSYLRSYAQAGCDELVLLPATAGLDQVERLAEVVAENHDVLLEAAG
jgi:alkanesulfonate monooxygenase SsuD/methylene tetrahydromethanopterin reductase-like flavin-dependent oxidoreductase (luciferase family)